VRFFNQKSPTTDAAALTATQSSGSLGDLVSPTSPSSRGSLLGALCLTSAFLFGEGRSEAQQAQPFQGGNSASSGPLVQHTGSFSEQDRQLFKEMLHHTGLVTPHRFEGIAGLRAYRALGRPPANSAAARAEHLASQMLQPFDHPFTNPDGKIVPPSILVVGGLTSIQSMFGSFGGAYRKLVNHQDQIKNSVAISDLLGVLQGAQKNQALQEDKILGWLNDSAHTLRLSNPGLLPVLSAEAAYVNSKLPRVLVHELAKDFNGYL